jgi:hypothetical protein
MTMRCSPGATPKGHVPNSVWAELCGAVILPFGPGAIGEIRGVTEFEMPPGPKSPSQPLAYSSAARESNSNPTTAFPLRVA